jgi:hypothetical protein
MKIPPPHLRAHHFHVMRCENPACTVHIVLFDEDEEAFADIPMNEDNCRYMLEQMQKALYGEAVKRDDEQQ